METLLKIPEVKLELNLNLGNLYWRLRLLCRAYLDDTVEIIKI